MEDNDFKTTVDEGKLNVLPGKRIEIPVLEDEKDILM